MAGRIGISDISPLVAGGVYPSRAVVGEVIDIRATVFREGHDAVAANVVWRGPAAPIVPGVRARAASRPRH